MRGHIVITIKSLTAIVIVIVSASSRDKACVALA
jgi:hypothetical protein